MDDLEPTVARPTQDPKAHFGPSFVLPLALGSTLNPINSTMISTALAPIALDFHATVAQTGWLVAAPSPPWDAWPTCSDPAASTSCRWRLLRSPD
jgi:hypothetical protein